MQQLVVAIQGNSTNIQSLVAEATKKLSDQGYVIKSATPSGAPYVLEGATYATQWLVIILAEKHS